MKNYINPYRLSNNFVEVGDVVNIFNMGTRKYWKCKIEYAQYITKPDWGIGPYETHHNETNETINVSDPSKGIISEKTPLAKAILEKKVGESFSYKDGYNTYVVGRIIGIKKPNGTIYGTIAVTEKQTEQTFMPNPPQEIPKQEKLEQTKPLTILYPLNAIRIAKNKKDVCINNYGEFVEYSNNLRSEYRKILKEWRKQKSNEENCSAYVIFSDRTLEQLICCPPFNKYTLYLVNGFSNEKIRKYGEDITNLTKNFFKENKIYDFLYGAEAFLLCLKKVKYILGFLGALSTITELTQ